MNLDLAAMYGTPGGQEEYEKVAEAELFAKLAAENGIDLNQLSDEQVAELYDSTFSKSAGGPGEEGGEEGGDGEDVKVAQAHAEFAAVEEWNEKVAEMDHLGRVMAHSFTQEMGAIKEAAEVDHATGTTTKERGRVGKAYDATKARVGRAYDSSKASVGRGVDAVNAHHARVGAAVGHRIPGINKPMTERMARNIGRGVYGAGAAAAGGAAYAAKRHMDKKGSAIDELAAESAFLKAAQAGYDQDEASQRLTAVLTLGLGDSEKIASAGSVDDAVEIRSLEFLEAAGYDVNWA